MPAEARPVDRRTHWEGIYGTKEESQLSWHQDDPKTSLALIGEFCPAGGRVVDVGGGTSLLAAGLVSAGYRDVTVLDISDRAIRRAQERAGAPLPGVRWIAADVTSAPPPGVFDLWHDRALFHFLTDPEDRRRYVEHAGAAVRPGGHVIVATFAVDGPEQCSGLPVQRYDGRTLSAAFATAFAPVRSLREMHVTPWGRPQAFVYVVLQRLAR
jgi:SAM-dependent methyltransferase